MPNKCVMQTRVPTSIVLPPKPPPVPTHDLTVRVILILILYGAYVIVAMKSVAPEPNSLHGSGSPVSHAMQQNGPVHDEFVAPPMTLTLAATPTSSIIHVVKHQLNLLGFPISS